MTGKIRMLARRFHNNQRGQMMVMAAFAMLTLFFAASLAIDFATVYFSYHQLQASTDAAAMAGAQNLGALNPTTASITTAATNYSSATSAYNAFGDLKNVTTTVTTACVAGQINTGTASKPVWTPVKGLGYNNGIECVNIGGSTTANAVKVTQTVNVPLTFAGVFNVASAPLTAVASAQMRGSYAPYNVAVVLDTTDSMSNTTDANCAGLTPLHCAMQGTQALLQALAPCSTTWAQTSACTSNPVDQVSLFVFPAVTKASATDDVCDPAGTPTTVLYPDQLQYTSPPDTFQLPVDPSANWSNNGFTYDYRVNDNATTLNQNSYLVKATNLTKTSGGGTAQCMQGPGGKGTYYAGVILQAYTALAAAYTARPQSSNVMVILSDGDATSKNNQMTCWIAATKTTSAHWGACSSTSGTYQSSVQECAQAVAAATYVKGTNTISGTVIPPTRIFTVGYQMANTGTCATDGPPYGPTTTSCDTMSSMATSSQYFFADMTSAKVCPPGQVNPPSTLAAIFEAIAANLTTARLMPNNVT